MKPMPDSFGCLVGAQIVVSLCLCHSISCANHTINRGLVLLALYHHHDRLPCPHDLHGLRSHPVADRLCRPGLIVGFAADLLLTR